MITLKEFEEKGHDLSLSKKELWYAAKNLPLDKQDWWLIFFQPQLTTCFYLKYRFEMFNAGITPETLRFYHPHIYKAPLVSDKYVEYLLPAEVHAYYERMEILDNPPVMEPEPTIEAIVEELF